MSIREKYNQTASIYNKRYREVQREKYKQMLAGLDLRGRVLDLGAGTGLLSEFLNIKVISMDISFQMLKQAKSACLQANAELLPFKSNSFDYILSFTTLQNCTEPEKAIKEAKRVLVSNGLFICTFLRSFESKLKPLLEKHFKILEKRECGEDIGLICAQTEKFIY